MKTRQLVAAAISFALATLSTASFANDFQAHEGFQAEHRGFADNQRDFKLDGVQGGIQVLPSAGSVQIVAPQEGRDLRGARHERDMTAAVIAVGSQPALRIEHREGRQFYQNRFEKRWGKNWHKKNRTKVIEVQPGDTLTKIANRYRTTVTNLMRLNNLTAYESNHIEIGQLIRLA
jgi:hypothetical protein